MISKEKAEEIYNKIISEWKKKYGEENLDKSQLEAIKYVIFNFPHADGCQRVVRIEDGKTYLVPIQDIILKGLKGTELKKYAKLTERRLR
jgi:hypothetical protein